MAPKNPHPRKALEHELKALMAASLGVPFAEKEKIMKLLPELSPEKLGKLRKILLEEERRNQTLLQGFLTKHPDLVKTYDRLKREHVNSLFLEIEKKERKEESHRMKEILDNPGT